MNTLTDLLHYLDNCACKDSSPLNLSEPYFTEQLTTYIGNKRALLPFINRSIEKIKASLGKDKLICLDGFAGSGVISRLLKYHSSVLHSNDFEKYSYIVNKCYLSNTSEINMDKIHTTIDKINQQAKEKLKGGFIYENYAPKDDNDIKQGERVFYTSYNAKMLDTLKELIYINIPEREWHFYLAPLIVVASINCNTSGVFKGFHKKNGLGCFGGAGENALTRIKRPITLQMPIFSTAECEINVSQKDTNELIKNDLKFDLAYYDPPYNQHPYGSNYFMLNILATPEPCIPIQSGISGIAQHWQRSAYNKKIPAIDAMDSLIKNTKSKYILVSYNNEGIIPLRILQSIFEKYGSVELMEQDYNTYRGSRNLRGRSIKIKELLWLIKKEK